MATIITATEEEKEIDFHGTVVGEKYRNPENHYTVLQIEDRRSRKINLVGYLACSFATGMIVAGRGTKTFHPVHGEQLNIVHIEQKAFASKDAIIDYLCSDSFPGITRGAARAVVERFGHDTPDILSNQPELLKEIKQLDSGRAQNLTALWKEKEVVNRVFTKIMQYDITANQAHKIYQFFAADSLRVVEEEPYKLAEIPGIGFRKADAIALKVGVSRTDPERVCAAVKYALEEALTSGHCYMEIVTLCNKTVDLLKDLEDPENSTPFNKAQEAVTTLFERKILHRQESTAVLMHVHLAERQVARKLAEIITFDRGVEHIPTREILYEMMDREGIGEIMRENDMVLAEQQEQAIMSALNDRVMILTGGPGTGKAQPNDTPVLTPQGYKPMGEIQIGDYVIGSNGQPTRVNGVFPQGKKSVFRVTFSDRTSTECCEDHLWSVRGKGDRSTTQGYRTLDTRQIAKKLQGSDRERRLYIPLVKPIALRERPLLMDPYLMGLLLGDGGFTQGMPRISCADEGLITALPLLMPKGVYCDKVPGDNVDYYLTTRNRVGKAYDSNPITAMLRYYNLWGCDSHSKFVPEDYLWGSIEDRLALLQGLMDSDGGVDENGVTLAFGSCSENLARGVQWLAQSLGCTATFADKQSRYKGEKHFSYRVVIAAPNGLSLFRSPRKLNQVVARTKYHPTKAIRSVDYSREAECTCLLVEAQDHLYCTNDCIVTHNTTITNLICRLLRQSNINYALCSPTGRAAKRLSEATGEDATTIHRLLEMKRDGIITYNASNPLTVQCVIVDEMSMVDIFLMRHLLDALMPSCRLIMVGDFNQLPSVGPGNVLKDLIESKVIPTIKLDQIFRQGKTSAIARAAHCILNGQMPDLPTPAESKGRNFMFVSAFDQELVKKYVVQMVSVELPRIGYNPKDIQVLTPMRARGLGVEDLNPILQEALNPPHPDKAELKSGFRVFREGDRIMQGRNDYDKGVFNGDVGSIQAITVTKDSTKIFVNFPDKEDLVEYESHEFDELSLAFCSTVHKMQGNEHPVIVMVAHDAHSNMLQRKLFYTGITRARKICLVIGTERAVSMCVNNSREEARQTHFKRWIKESMEAERGRDER